MKASELMAALPLLIEDREPTFLWGPPGVGKSALLAQVAAQMDALLIDFRAVYRQATDILGFPQIKDDVMRWVPPAELPKPGGRRSIFLLEELPQAPGLVQAACLQITHDRRVGEYVLPENCSVVAAGNRHEDRAGANRMITPLLNRFTHLDMEVDAQDWNAWALTAGVGPITRAYLQWKPASLFDFDPSKHERAWATPRTWEKADRRLRTVPDALLYPVLAGTVGEAKAVELTAFARLYKSLPDVNAILADPEHYAVPKEPDVLFATSGAIVERCRTENDLKTLEAAAKYGRRMPAEFSAVTMRDLVGINPAVIITPTGKTWMGEHREVILSGGAR